MPPIDNPDQGNQEKPPETSLTATAPPPSPAASTPSEPTPPPKPAKVPTDPAVWARRLKRTDHVLAFLLLLLTFFLGSFAVTNSDFWMHLSTGRLIAQGEYAFGEDPFAFTTEGRTWVNHQWLYDWALYGTYQLLGEEGLVAGKALLLVALVWVLLQIRRRDQSLALPLLFATLAILAASVQYHFRPLLLSYLLLAIVLALLFHGETEWTAAGAAPARMPRHLWWVPAVFVLWANVDVWFWAGLLAIGLYWLGTAMQAPRAQPVAPRHLAVVFALSALACVVNPHHVQVFSLPPELAYPLVSMADAVDIPLPGGFVAAGRTMQQIRQYHPESLALFGPFSANYMNYPPDGLVGWPIGSTYFVLLAAGVLSFVCTYLTKTLAWPRLLPWLFFAMASLFQFRFIGFFAIVSAPVIVLNLQDLARRHTVADATPSVRSPLLARLAGGVVLAALLFMAWPGWLHAKLNDWQAPRRVAWRLAPNSSWEKATQRMKELHDAGLRQGLCFDINIAHYSAWACPEVKHFYDYRYGLFPGVAERIGKLRREVDEEAKFFFERKPQRLQDFPEWSKATRQYGFQYVVLTDANPRMSVRRWLDPEFWPLLYQDGKALIFGNDVAGGSQAFAPFRLSWAAEAFGKVVADKRTQPLKALPAKTPGFAELYYYGRPPPSLALYDFRSLGDYAQVPSQWWTGHVVAVSVIANSHGQFPPASLYFVTPYSQVWSQGNLERVHKEDKTGSAVARMQVFNPAHLTGTAMAMDPAVRILMMRRARQALAENAQDPSAYECLFIAAGNLQTLENTWGRGGGPLCASIRLLQRLVSLKSYSILEPKNPDAHEKLAEIYAQIKYFDVAKEHFALALKHMDRVPEPKGAKDWPQYVQSRKKYFKMRVDELEEGGDNFVGLKKLNDEFDSKVAGQNDPLARADLALKYGFSRKALSLYEKVVLNEIKSLGVQRAIVARQLSLLLHLGRVQEVRDHLERDVKNLFLGKDFQPPDFGWHYLNALAAAVVGDYPAVETSLAHVEAPVEARRMNEAFFYATALSTRFVQAQPLTAGTALQGFAVGWQKAIGLKQPAEVTSIRLTRGLMALEHGNTALAAEHFERVLAILGRDARFIPDHAIAVEYLRRIKARQ